MQLAIPLWASTPRFRGRPGSRGLGTHCRRSLEHLWVGVGVGNNQPTGSWVSGRAIEFGVMYRDGSVSRAIGGVAYLEHCRMKQDVPWPSRRSIVCGGGVEVGQSRHNRENPRFARHIRKGARGAHTGIRRSTHRYVAIALDCQQGVWVGGVNRCVLVLVDSNLNRPGAPGSGRGAGAHTHRRVQRTTPRTLTGHTGQARRLLR